MLTKDEGIIIAREAIELARRDIETCPKAEARLKARAALDEAEKEQARGAARPALAWACRSVQHSHGITSPAYAEVQAKYDVVYDSHLA